MHEHHEIVPCLAGAVVESRPCSSECMAGIVQGNKIDVYVTRICLDGSFEAILKNTWIVVDANDGDAGGERIILSAQVGPPSLSTDTSLSHVLRREQWRRRCINHPGQLGLCSPRPARIPRLRFPSSDRRLGLARLTRRQDRPPAGSPASKAAVICRAASAGIGGELDGAGVHRHRYTAAWSSVQLRGCSYERVMM